MRTFMVLGIVVASSLARAGTAPMPGPETLVAEALRANPSLEALRLQVAALRAETPAAGALPDPMVELRVGDAPFPPWADRREDMTTVGVEARQGFLLAGKRRARTEAAQAATGQRETELTLLKAELVREVRETYAALYALDAELAVLDDAGQLLSVLREATTQRYAAGLASQEASIKVMLVETGLQDRADDLRQRRVVLQAKLNRLLNRPLGTSWGTVAVLPEVPVLSLEDLRPALDSSPVMAAARAELERASAEVAVARSELGPNPFLFAGLAERRGVGAMVSVGVGLEWPAWRRSKQQPILDATQNRQKAAEARLEAARAEVRQQLEEIARSCALAARQLARAREELLPLADEARKAALAAYLAGQEDFSTVVENFNAWLQAKVAIAKRQAEAFAYWARGQALLGDAGGEG